MEVTQMTLEDYFIEFETKYSQIEEITREWYWKTLKVSAYNITTAPKDSKGKRSEEWFRARFVYALVKSKMFPSNTICVEFVIPKGSEGAKSLNPDVLIFKDDTWKGVFDSWDKNSVLPEELRKSMLVVCEAKNNTRNVETAVTKQMGEAMNSYIGNQVFGVYFDNRIDPLIFIKEGTNSIKRYNPSKNIDGENLIDKLNIDNRDNLVDLPSFKTFIKNITKTDDLAHLNFDNTDAIDEDSFTNLLAFMNRELDRLSLSHSSQDLIVEFLTLKVSDEKEVKSKTKNYFDFYILDNEITSSNQAKQTFRERIKLLYERAKTKYHSIFNPQCFSYYEDASTGKLMPSNANDEQFLIGLVNIFDKKSILHTKNKSFNQIIFNNFGSSVEKAKEKQFFTPVPIVEMIVKMINPKKDETICDPCSGICDFLAMSFRHIYHDELENLPSADKFYGFDSDPEILKLAELNLVLNGDGNANIKTMNSISQKLLVDGTCPDNYFDTTHFDPTTWKNLDDSSKDIMRYDVVITNPPFGKGRDLKTGKDGKWDIKPSVMKMYDTWTLKGNPKSIDMGAIFLENAYKLLKEGGRMAIVLSNSLVSIEDWKYLREWLFKKMRIVGLVELPNRSFGETGVATTVIFAYKPKRNESSLLESNYELYIREAENIGYEVKTKDRIVIMSPTFIINPETLEREKDSLGNDKKLTDFPSIVDDFGAWLDSIKTTDLTTYRAFNGDDYQRWSEDD